MLKQLVAVVVLLFGGKLAILADTIGLKDKAAVTGKILAEKPDQIVVDLGYTVLTIPRQDVLTISRGAKGEPRSEPTTLPESGPPSDLKSGIYYATNQPQSERSVRELVKQLGEAVVQVRTPSGLGSGFIINEEGYLITNFHVIEGETQISVEVYHQEVGQLERKVYKQVRVVAVNKFKDLALLKIEDADAPRFLRVPLGDSEALQVGDHVFAVGSPLGLERTVTEGILSTKTRELQGELFLQTSAQINPGNSGGPLFNLAGEVVGVINMKVTFGEGLGFAIPITATKYFLDHRDAFLYSNDNPGNPYRYLQPPTRTKHRGSMQ